MSATAVRALIALAVLAGCVFLAFTQPARLGLDLRGGTQITLQARDTAAREADAETTDRAVEVLRRRVDALGVAEPTLTRAGEDRIIVELPGLQDPRQASEVIGRTAQLTFHKVTGIADPEVVPSGSASPSGAASAAASPTASPTAASPAASATGTASPSPTSTGGATTEEENQALDDQLAGRPLTLEDESGQSLSLAAAALTGEAVDDANAVSDQFGAGWMVNIDFRGGGGDTYRQITGEAACAPPGAPERRIAIVLDGEIISAPQVATDVGCNQGIAGGTTSITGDFSRTEAQELALLVRGGALPVPVEIIEQRVVGPTLGDEAIEASLAAAIIGTILTALFMLFVYRFSGLLAVVGMAAYGVIAYGALLVLDATLTLPGLAGALLALGSVIDTNVLVNERAREEWHAQKRKSLPSAIQAGFSRAGSGIADSNITTLLAAGLLFFLASGPVRGFGVTLSLGVLAGLFSSLVVVRVLTEITSTRTALRNRPGATGLASLGRVRIWLQSKNLDLMRRGRLWLTIAGVALIVAIAGMFVRGLNLGVEFTGGRIIEYSADRPFDVDAVRSQVADAGYPRAVVQRSGDGEISVRVGELTNAEADDLKAAVEESAGSVTVERDELIGPTLGDELRRKALIALAIALAAQMVYMAVRFRVTFAAAAVLAMLHDVVIVTGVFAWLGRPIDGVYLAAVLAIIGLSVNDSVVVFDRIRDTWRGRRKDRLASIANEAVIATIPRTVNTGMGALFILAALLFLGGESLTDFALAMFIGLLVGTASSVFIATPLLLVLERRWPSTPPAPPAPKTAPRIGTRSETGGAVV